VARKNMRSGESNHENGRDLDRRSSGKHTYLPCTLSKVAQSTRDDTVFQPLLSFNSVFWSRLDYGTYWE
jgi:hypothetical protein